MPCAPSATTIHPGSHFALQACAVRLFCIEFLQMKHTLLLYQTRALTVTGIQVALMIDGMAAAVARAEALPHDALRQAHPRERTLEDLRLEQPELIVGCWASGWGTHASICLQD